MFTFFPIKTVIMRHQDAVYNWSVKSGTTIEFWHLTKLFSQLKKNQDFHRIIQKFVQTKKIYPSLFYGIFYLVWGIQSHFFKRPLLMKKNYIILKRGYKNMILEAIKTHPDSCGQRNQVPISNRKYNKIGWDIFFCYSLGLNSRMQYVLC